MSEGASGIGGYIKHHLQNGTYELVEGSTFWTIHIDSVIIFGCSESMSLFFITNFSIGLRSSTLDSFKK